MIFVYFLNFGKPLTAQNVTLIPLDNQKFIPRITYFDLNLDQPGHHLFVVSLDIRGKIFNNFDDLCDILYVANKPKNVNVKVHNTQQE